MVAVTNGSVIFGLRSPLVATSRFRNYAYMLTTRNNFTDGDVGRRDCNTGGLFQYRYFGIGPRQYRDPGIPPVFIYNVMLGHARRPILDNGLWKGIPEPDTESLRLE